MASTDFRFHRLLPLIFMVFLTISVWSFHPEDMDFFAGGLQGSAYPHNFFGAWGTKISWFLLVTLGLGTYHMLFLTLLCLLRRFLWRKGLLASNWEYFLSLILNVVSVSLMLGTMPEAMPGCTAALNISHFPGGILGQFLGSPEQGCISQAINTTGCFIFAFTLFCLTLGFLFRYDWMVPAKAAAKALQEYWRRKQAERAAKEQAAKERAEQPPPPPPVQADVRFSGTSEPPPATTFRARRGLESIQADRQAQEAILGRAPAPAPPRYQAELPLADAPVPQPARTPQRPAPPPPPPPRRPPAPPKPAPEGKYTLPDPEEFFPPGRHEGLNPVSDEELEANKRVIQKTLDDFGMDADVVNATAGPQVTLYEVQMGSGTSVTRLGSCRRDISLALKAPRHIRMLLPIPGKGLAGIEVPNQKPALVCAHELFTSSAWQTTRKHIPLMLGNNFQGNPCIMDLEEAPHLLIAGSTGSGKSGCMNLLIQSLLLRFTPDELRLMMVDPKMLEFAPYERIPHLAAPIINEVSQVGPLLNWACVEMDKRYRQMKAVGVRKLTEFNNRPLEGDPAVDSDGDPVPDHLPHLVIIIDELAEITLQVKKDVDLALSRLGGKARAAGIHMIVATQRPSREVFTGVIKSNFPYRIALKASDSTNSRIILGQSGAEDLLGKGDMLYSTGGAELERIQCGWVENREIADVTAFWAQQGVPQYNESLMRALEPQEEEEEGEGADGLGLGSPMGDEAGEGDLISQALRVLRQYKRPTISILQRHLRIGYNKSASLMQDLEDLHYVGPQPISGLREIYWENFPDEDARDDFREPEEPREEEDGGQDAPAPAGEGLPEDGPSFAQRRSPAPPQAGPEEPN